MAVREGSITAAEASRRTGLHPNTIRHWAATGILSVAEKTPAGHRRYNADEVSRVAARIANERNKRMTGEPIEAVVRRRLIRGEDPRTLVAEGMAKSTVYKVRAQLGVQQDTIAGLSRRVERLERVLRHHRLLD